MKNQFTEIKRFRLDSMPRAQCHIAIEYSVDGIRSISLFSYETRVITISILNREEKQKVLFSALVYCYPGNGSWSSNCYDLTYSPTTARHINRFTQEFFGENKYQDVKRCAEDADVFWLFGISGVVARANWYMEHGKRFYGNY